MQVRTIKWGELPKQDWKLLLNELPEGELIGSLPFAYLKELKRVRIPLESGAILNFEKVSAISPEGVRTFIWRRAKTDNVNI